MIITYESVGHQDEPLNVKRTVKFCRSSYYMVHSVSKDYNLGTIQGRCRYYTPKEVEFIKQVIHYRKYGRRVISMYTFIKRFPGITDKDLRKYMNISPYTYNVVLATLTESCYLWEDEEASKYGNPKSVYYIDGEFFESHIELLRGKLSV